MSESVGQGEGLLLPVAVAAGAEPISPTKLTAVRKLVWPEYLKEGDVLRWFQQGFEWSGYEGSGFGLLQRKGGPCGVLAAVQAFVVWDLLFGRGSPTVSTPLSGLKLSDKERRWALARALALILWRAAVGGERGATEGKLCGEAMAVDSKKPTIRLVVRTSSGAPLSAATPASELRVLRFDSMAAAARFLAGDDGGAGGDGSGGWSGESGVGGGSDGSGGGGASGKEREGKEAEAEAEEGKESEMKEEEEKAESGGEGGPWSGSLSSGVALLVYSLVLTRGVDNCVKDMDDPGTCLTCNFGQCEQSLLNLLLIGRATANVHDGDKVMGGESGGKGGGLGRGGGGGGGGGGGSADSASGKGTDSSDDDKIVFRGVDCPPLIGFLSHLEALRYVQVGNFLKHPIAPIWVVGSQSHYTLLFSEDAAASAVSWRGVVMQACKRAFAGPDPTEQGFIVCSRDVLDAAVATFVEAVGVERAAAQERSDGVTAAAAAAERRKARQQREGKGEEGMSGRDDGFEGKEEASLTKGKEREFEISQARLSDLRSRLDNGSGIVLFAEFVQAMANEYCDFIGVAGESWRSCKVGAGKHLFGVEKIFFS